jgi:hypothetical protein
MKSIILEQIYLLLPSTSKEFVLILNVQIFHFLMIHIVLPCKRNLKKEVAERLKNLLQKISKTFSTEVKNIPQTC